MEFAHDFYGRPINVGDTVICIVSYYTGVLKGQKRVVTNVPKPGLITLNNIYSPYGTSDYHSYNFNKIYSAKKKENSKDMLNLAIRTPNNLTNYQEVVDYINTREDIFMLSSTNPAKLKNMVELRIKSNPEERWIILRGDTIAEISSPPVSFRSW